MADKLFSRTVALLAASFLATSYCSAGLDRIVVGLNQGILFACLFIYLLLLAEEKGSILLGLLSGCCLGVGLGAYEPFKSAMAAFFIFIIYRIVFERGYIRKNWAVLAMLVIGFLAIASSLLPRHREYGMQHGVGQMVFFGNRHHGLNMDSINMFLTDIRLFLRMIFLRMSESIFLINSGPMLNDFLVPLFFLGFVCTLYRWRNYACFLVLAWFVFAPMAGILTWPCTRRLTIFFPAVAIMAAIGAFLLIKTMLSSLRLKGGVFFVGVMMIVVLCLFTVDTYVYFNKAINRTFEHHKEASDYAVRQIGGSYIYFVDLAECANVMNVMTYERRGGEEPSKFYSFIKDRDIYSKIFNTPPHDMVFVVWKHKTKTLSDIVDRIPFARVEEGKHMSRTKLRGSKFLEERGAEVLYELVSDEDLPMQRVAAKTLATEFDWEDQPLRYPFRMALEGYFYVPEDGKYDFKAIGDGETEVCIDGDQINMSLSRDCDLKRGSHSIRVEHLQNAPGKFSLVWGKRGVPPGPIYLWGGLFQDMFDLTLPPTPTPTPTSTATPTITPTPTQTPRRRL
ncbi:MAG: glycosyltransferase family 39 protein, partial [bacterium]